MDRALLLGFTSAPAACLSWQHLPLILHGIAASAVVHLLGSPCFCRVCMISSTSFDCCGLGQLKLYPGPFRLLCLGLSSDDGNALLTILSLLQVKILKKAAKSDKKSGPSRGVAFLEFASHDHAMAALRQMNNNPNIFGKPCAGRHSCRTLKPTPTPICLGACAMAGLI